MKKEKKSRRSMRESGSKSAKNASVGKKHDDSFLRKVYKASFLRENQQHLSVIISVYNEEETIGALLKSVKKLNPKEIIVIENGSTDQTLDVCLDHGVKCISYPFRLGHDVGRAIGARESTGDVLLFLDGDIVFSSKDLAPFVAACYEGVDLALNDVNPFYTNTELLDYVSLAKAFLNKSLLHSELGYASLTAVPNAMRRSAVELIGYNNLAVPPKAQAMAAILGLSIRCVHFVNVFKPNKVRLYNSTENNRVEQMILGDHIEAIEWARSVKGDRVFFADHLRRREILDQLSHSLLTSEDQLLFSPTQGPN
ncbi:glycosyltransferase family 2 protein [Brevibacillus fulvus]|uniref:Glycosyltransferase involved in cell wall biosynthesis n=1 Tax=Brevibacillus fulvus TaxID=1125967 RepID=A0A938XWL8_9BACL|nr:glycosyltransferase family 2 protein [Brevibacillus fulvus]MBM7589040.1 glycosyltransferase involved in cell wall biosynthesis [Brevibacillus fulvus]